MTSRSIRPLLILALVCSCTVAADGQELFQGALDSLVSFGETRPVEPLPGAIASAAASVEPLRPSGESPAGSFEPVSDPELLVAAAPARPPVFQTGMASFYGYGDGFHGRRTANGEIFDTWKRTAAHKTLPFGTRVEVTRLDTGATVVVRINDRGPYSGGRIIDLSTAAADALGMRSAGVARVSLRILR